MNWLDIIILVALAVPTYIGLRRGLIQTILPLGGIMLGVFLAGRFYDSLAGTLSSWLESPSQAKIVAFIVIFLAVVAIAMVVAWLASRFVSLVLLGWVDKLGGALFGLAIGAFIASALLAVVARFPFSGSEETVRGSILAEFFLDHFPFVLGLLPDEFENVRRFFD